MNAIIAGRPQRIDPILDFSSRSNGGFEKHHGVGYLGNNLLEFWTSENGLVDIKKISTGQCREWIEKTTRLSVQDKTYNRYYSDDEASLRWMHDLKAAIK